MGYGSRALSLLKMYYEFLIPNIDEGLLPKENIDSIQEEEVDLLEERIGTTYYIYFTIVIIQLKILFNCRTT